MRIRLLSYNVEVGIETRNYSDYVTGGWKHFLPTRARQDNLQRIADFLRAFDIVALQEVDAGSIRSGHVNQIKFLAEQAGFDYWHNQINRNIGKLAKHSNGLLSRYRPTLIIDHKLPGIVPGRGAIAVQYGEGEEALILVVVHLALGNRTRSKQMSYLVDIVRGYKHVVMMGDMNCSINMLSKHVGLREVGLKLVDHGHTFPSWRPSRSIDHILVSPSISVEHIEVLPHMFSDHLPVAVDVTVPVNLQL